MRQNVPSYAKSFVDRAAELEKTGEFEAAVAIYREGLALHPEVAVLHNNFGCCLANQEKYQEAKRRKWR
jgi:Tfp pilus assembly protein PilF